MSDIIDFYKGSKPDHAGRYWGEIVSQTDDWLESTHDFIQWLFPLNETSQFSKNAPILSKKDIDEFKITVSLQNRLLASFAMMLSFYGLELYRENDELIIRKDNIIFQERASVWLSPNNHQTNVEGYKWKLSGRTVKRKFR